MIATFKTKVANQVETTKSLESKTGLFCSCNELRVSELSKYPIQIESLYLAVNILEVFEAMQSKQIL